MPAKQLAGHVHEADSGQGCKVICTVTEQIREADSCLLAGVALITAGWKHGLAGRESWLRLLADQTLCLNPVNNPCRGRFLCVRISTGSATAMCVFVPVNLHVRKLGCQVEPMGWRLASLDYGLVVSSNFHLCLMPSSLTVSAAILGF